MGIFVAVYLICVALILAGVWLGIKYTRGRRASKQPLARTNPPAVWGYYNSGRMVTRHRAMRHPTPDRKIIATCGYTADAHHPVH